MSSTEIYIQYAKGCKDTAIMIPLTNFFNATTWALCREIKGMPLRGDYDIPLGGSKEASEG